VDLQRTGTELLAEATGRSHRDDAVLGRSGGPAGNARLTAWTGLVLLVLFLAEIVTTLDVEGWLSWHVVIGVLLVPPALLKTAVTGWRFLRYYSGNRPYRTAGPPLLPLRLLGPLVVLSTLALLGSGLTLIALGEQRARSASIPLVGDWVSLHQALFVVFDVVVGLHVLARIVPAVRLAAGRRKENPGGARRIPGELPRWAVLVLALAVAGLTAALVLPAASSWHHDGFGHDGGPVRFDGPPPGR
jgi:hypothetical protein